MVVVATLTAVAEVETTEDINFRKPLKNGPVTLLLQGFFAFNTNGFKPFRTHMKKC
jgi:hypothetical protein